jgi:hypothetical protein
MRYRWHLRENLSGSFPFSGRKQKGDRRFGPNSNCIAQQVPKGCQGMSQQCHYYRRIIE